MDSVYEVFERINTGGMKLSPQEIRSCVAYGEFNTTLFQLNKNQLWREIYGKESLRLKDIELILRFFAFRENRDNYKLPMKKFLTDYMVETRNPSIEFRQELTNHWEKVIQKLHDAVGNRIFRPSGRAMNVAFFDSFSVATSLKIEDDPNLTSEQVKAAYERLGADEDFQQSILSGTATVLNVSTRFSLALDSYNT